MTLPDNELDLRNPYADEPGTANRVRESGHRKVVGGMWDEIGQLQREYLVSQGLVPSSLLLDVGCGALRGGVGFVDYLNPGHYFGIDNNQPLIDAGYDVELKNAGLQDKLPRENLICRRDFDARQFGRSFDVALAQSIFTHIPLNEIKRALSAVSRVIKPGGKFYTTFFKIEDDEVGQGHVVHLPGNIKTYPDANPFHQSIAQLRSQMNAADWHFEYIGDWGHPRAQMMALFTRR